MGMGKAGTSLDGEMDIRTFGNMIDSVGISESAKDDGRSWPPPPVSRGGWPSGRGVDFQEGLDRQPRGEGQGAPPFGDGESDRPRFRGDVGGDRRRIKGESVLFRFCLRCGPGGGISGIGWGGESLDLSPWHFANLLGLSGLCLRPFRICPRLSPYAESPGFDSTPVSSTM